MKGRRGYNKLVRMQGGITKRTHAYQGEGASFFYKKLCTH